MSIITKFSLFESKEFYIEIEERLNSPEWEKLPEHENEFESWIRPLSREGFYCIISYFCPNEEGVPLVNGYRAFHNNSEYLFYLKDNLGKVNYMDSLLDEFGVFKGKKDIDKAIEICEMQLEYYKHLEKYPSEKAIRECLYPFTDNKMYLNSDIEYGYIHTNIYQGHDLVRYHKIHHTNGEFACAFIVVMPNLNNKNTNHIRKWFNEILNNFKMEIEDLTNKEVEIRTSSDERGLHIFLIIK